MWDRRWRCTWICTDCSSWQTKCWTASLVVRSVRGMQLHAHAVVLTHITHNPPLTKPHPHPYPHSHALLLKLFLSDLLQSLCNGARRRGAVLAWTEELPGLFGLQYDYKASCAVGLHGKVCTVTATLHAISLSPFARGRRNALVCCFEQDATG